MPIDYRQFTRTREETALARRLRYEASKTERKLWPHLQRGAMGAPFRRQHSVTKRHTDYCCIPLKLVVEIDGPTHSARRDAARDHRMNRRGFDVIRFSVQQVDENLEGVVATIHQEVQLRLLRNPNRKNRQDEWG